MDLLGKYDSYGGVPPHQSHSETSREAAESVAATVGKLQYKVYLALVDAGWDGLTDEELIEKLSGTGQVRANAIRPRRIELRDKGLVQDSGRTRPTSKRRNAVVWIAVHPSKAPEVKAERDRLHAAKCGKCGQPGAPDKATIRAALKDLKAMQNEARRAGFQFDHLEESAELGKWLKGLAE